MTIPVRCYGCGKVIGSKYEAYLRRVVELRKKENRPTDDLNIINFNSSELEKTVEGRVMDELGLVKLCCRKIFLGHVDPVQ